MLKKIYGIFKLIFNLYITWLIKYYFSKNKKQGRLNAKEELANYADYIFRNYLFDDIKINGHAINDKFKINLVMVNHFSTIDFLILISILKHFNMNKYYFIFKESIIKVPILGDLTLDDIRISRDWNSDQELISNQLKNIDNGTIIIYPEGTRYDKKKHVESKKFCFENKLPIFNYTLTPKAKGTHHLLKLLKKQNKLGNVYDITLILPGFINKDFYLFNLLNFKELGTLHVYCNEIDIKEEDMNYDKFKYKLYMIWLNKNFLFDKLIKSKY